MNQATPPCRWLRAADEDAFRRRAVETILASAEAAIRARGRFVVALAGGNTPRRIYEALRPARADWAGWHVYFGDERCAPPGDPGRNSRMALDAWLTHVPIPLAQVHAIPGELGARRAAAAYAAALEGVADFDLVLLGLGEDGHTASLFPGHDWGTAAGSPDALPVFDAPKPPPERVTLSAARLSRARRALFLASGESKRPAIEAWRAGRPLPAAAIRPPGGVEVLTTPELLSPGEGFED